MANQVVDTCLEAIKKIQDNGPTKKQLQSAFRILGSGREPPPSANKLPTDATTLFSADVYTADITEALTPDLARDLLTFMLPLNNYTAVKLLPSAMKGLASLTVRIAFCPLLVMLTDGFTKMLFSMLASTNLQVLARTTLALRRSPAQQLRPPRLSRAVLPPHNLQKHLRTWFLP
jgi:hypothetical protein